uniref:Uncharacterized protein n=1 Tax=Romanomermis culicivorax TaxID=13658 RepID=A0A915JFA1_ROMCU
MTEYWRGSQDGHPEQNRTLPSASKLLSALHVRASYTYPQKNSHNSSVVRPDVALFVGAYRVPRRRPLQFEARGVHSIKLVADDERLGGAEYEAALNWARRPIGDGPTYVRWQAPGGRLSKLRLLWRALGEDGKNESQKRISMMDSHLMVHLSYSSLFRGSGGSADRPDGSSVYSTGTLRESISFSLKTDHGIRQGKRFRDELVARRKKTY